MSDLSKQKNTRENTSDFNGILDGIDTLLSIVENSTTFHKTILKRFGKRIKGSLLKVIKFGSLDRDSYETLRNIDPKEFEDLFKKIDFSQAEKKLGITVPSDFINTAAIEFRAGIIECLTRYQIFSHFKDSNFSEKYNEISRGKGFIIYQSKETSENFLKIGPNFIPEVKIRDTYNEPGEDYLFFIDIGATHYFNFQTGELVTIEGELDETYVLDNKTYLVTSYPNSENPTNSEVHCVEDDFSYDNTIKEQGGFILGMFMCQGDVCILESGYFEYSGFHNGEKSSKGKLTLITKKLYGGEIIEEQNGVLKDNVELKNGTVVTSISRVMYQKGENTFSHLEKAEIRFFQKNGISDLEGYHLDIPTRKIVDIIATSHDYIIVCNETNKNNSEPNDYQVFSLVSRCGIGSQFTQQKITSLTIQKDETGITIIGYDENKNSHTLKSLDYFPLLLDQEVSGYFH